jgi:hypothetical protein
MKRTRMKDNRRILKEIELKNIKVTKKSWRAVKVFVSSHDYNIRTFVEEAIKEKLQRESSKIVVELKEKEEAAPGKNSGPEENEFEAIGKELSRFRYAT